MGQYFYFYNKTRNEKSSVGCKYNGGLKWMPKLNCYSETSAKQIFLQIIEDNNWSNDDEIIADGDSGDVVTYKNKIVFGCTGEFSDDE